MKQNPEDVRAWELCKLQLMKQKKVGGEREDGASNINVIPVSSSTDSLQ